MNSSQYTFSEKLGHLVEDPLSGCLYMIRYSPNDHITQHGYWWIEVYQFTRIYHQVNFVEPKND